MTDRAFCPNCGAPKGDGRFCSGCGASYYGTRQPSHAAPGMASAVKQGFGWMTGCLLFIVVLFLVIVALG